MANYMCSNLCQYRQCGKTNCILNLCIINRNLSLRILLKISSRGACIFLVNFSCLLSIYVQRYAKVLSTALVQQTWIVSVTIVKRNWFVGQLYRAWTRSSRWLETIATFPPDYLTRGRDIMTLTVSDQLEFKYPNGKTSLHIRLSLKLINQVWRYIGNSCIFLSTEFNFKEISCWQKIFCLLTFVR